MTECLPVSGKPSATLRFCSACVAAPLSRLSSDRDDDDALAAGRDSEAADLDMTHGSAIR